MGSWKTLTIALSMFATSASSWAAFFDGNELHGWLLENEKPNGSAFKSGLFRGYVAGVVDLGDELLFCTGPGVTAGQYAAVVAKYLKNNPEKWNKSADSLVVEALREAFPCKK